ncbi:hypothetical protein [Pseudohoeflea coraliihabitans]|uniref:Secreted protein n=1 Tax=Pseudohoeflea coraliihabitans TaxID=2860393 RepID=A0ABS6WLE9_9HYPH|nr:hypothetical protein [Pseudohoeflea sp. DP4N28-3]MBW3096778.1 hypothetical protein [Pseudohoeflea sp. DP4N28-3]
MKIARSLLTFLGAAVLLVAVPQTGSSQTPGGGESVTAPGNKVLYLRKRYTADGDRHGRSVRRGKWREEAGHRGLRSENSHRRGEERRRARRAATTRNAESGYGTLSGNLSGVRDPGNGIYFYREGESSGVRVLNVPQPSSGAIIVPVMPQSFSEACSRNSGVCIIRPN